MNSKSLFLLFICFLMTPLVCEATADGPDHFSVTGVESWDVLNIRVKPHYKSKKVGSIPYNGKCVENLGCVGGLTLHEFETLSNKQQKAIIKKRPYWCKVRYRGTVGYVNGRYLSEGACY